MCLCVVSEKKLIVFVDGRSAIPLPLRVYVPGEQKNKAILDGYCFQPGVHFARHCIKQHHGILQYCVCVCVFTRARDVCPHPSVTSRSSQPSRPCGAAVVMSGELCCDGRSLGPHCAVLASSLCSRAKWTRPCSEDDCFEPGNESPSVPREAKTLPF